MKMKTMVRKTVLYGIIGLSSLIMLLPFFWMLSASLKPETAVFQFPIQWIPEKPLWSNYVNIWEKIPLARYYLNTVKIAFCVTFLQLFTCSLAAYAFAKINFPERDKLFLVYLGTMMVPFQVVMIPQFILLKQFHLANTHTGLILLQAFSPFGVFMLRQYYLNIPTELSEAARIDGLSEFGIYSRVILPLSRPALASLAIFTASASWNDFLAPLIFLNDSAKKTLQIGIRSFMAESATDYASIMAASVCGLLPVVIVFILLQKYFVEGVASSGLKG